jgi:transposase
MVLHVAELNAIEREQLRKWSSSQDVELGHRVQVVLLSAEGYRIPEIAAILGAHPANLRKWIHRFNRHRCRGLITVRSGGAKPRFSEEQKARIIALAASRPRELGLSFSTWTLHRIAEQARREQIVDRISHEYIRQILKAANCSYKGGRAFSPAHAAR